MALTLLSVIFQKGLEEKCKKVPQQQLRRRWIVIVGIQSAFKSLSSAASADVVPFFSRINSALVFSNLSATACLALPGATPAPSLRQRRVSANVVVSVVELSSLRYATRIFDFNLH
ncbi:hypothetical protein TYRP_006730 [Tyrophagus putrescentiae]|nr:hypothetical protein TYRP_006730 [Tyrophagus putrescentiae]